MLFFFFFLPFLNADSAHLPRDNDVLHSVEYILKVLRVGCASDERIHGLLLVVDAIDKLGADILGCRFESILSYYV